MSVLVVSGNPSKEILESAKNDILYDFSIASGGTSSFFRAVQKINHLRTRLILLNISYVCLERNNYDEAKKYLKTEGIILNDKVELTIKACKGKINHLTVLYKEELKRYNDNINKGREGKGFTISDFEEQLAGVSQSIGFKINKNDTTLSEYAAYLKNIKKQIENGKSKQHIADSSKRIRRN